VGFEDDDKYLIDLSCGMIHGLFIEVNIENSIFYLVFGAWNFHDF